VSEPKPAPWYLQPVWLGVLGLALMVAGWKLSTYAPLPQQVDDLYGMADRGLRDRLDRMRPVPPYLWPGRLAFLGGVALFVLAGALMFRKPPARPEEQGDRPQEA
jgi:hypothetical protein